MNFLAISLSAGAGKEAFPRLSILSDSDTLFAVRQHLIMSFAIFWCKQLKNLHRTTLASNLRGSALFLPGVITSDAGNP